MVLLVPLEQWVFMEREVHLDCLALRVTVVQLAVEEILDRLVKRENVALKDRKEQLVWLDFQLRKEKEEMLDFVENKAQLVKRV